MATSGAASGSSPTSRGRSAEPDEAADGAPLSPRELRRRRRIQVGREQILDAAEDLFGRHGYQATSLEQVARRCEFSVGALYTFFTGKQELLEAVQLRRGPQQLAEMEACLAEDLPGDRTLLRICRAVLDFHRRYPGFGRFSLRVFSPGLERLPAADGQQLSVERAVGAYAAAIERGQADGTIRDGDPRRLARLVAALVTTHLVTDPEPSDDGRSLTADDLLDIVAAAMAPRRTPAA